MWFMGCTRFLECTVLGHLYQDSVGFSWSKKTKHLEDTRNIHGLKFSTKICGKVKDNSQTKEGVSGSLLNWTTSRTSAMILGVAAAMFKSAGVSLCSNCAIAAKLVVCEWLPYLIVPRESEPQWTSTHQPNRARWMMMMVCGLETHL